MSDIIADALNENMQYYIKLHQKANRNEHRKVNASAKIPVASKPSVSKPVVPKPAVVSHADYDEELDLALALSLEEEKTCKKVPAPVAPKSAVASHVDYDEELNLALALSATCAKVPKPTHNRSAPRPNFETKYNDEPTVSPRSSTSKQVDLKVNILTTNGHHMVFVLNDQWFNDIRAAVNKKTRNMVKIREMFTVEAALMNIQTQYEELRKANASKYNELTAQIGKITRVKRIISYTLTLARGLPTTGRIHFSEAYLSN